MVQYTLERNLLSPFSGEILDGSATGQLWPSPQRASRPRTQSLPLWSTCQEWELIHAHTYQYIYLVVYRYKVPCKLCSCTCSRLGRSLNTSQTFLTNMDNSLDKPGQKVGTCLPCPLQVSFRPTLVRYGLHRRWLVPFSCWTLVIGWTGFKAGKQIKINCSRCKNESVLCSWRNLPANRSKPPNRCLQTLQLHRKDNLSSSNLQGAVRWSVHIVPQPARASRTNCLICLGHFLPETYIVSK